MPGAQGISPALECWQHCQRDTKKIWAGKEAISSEIYQNRNSSNFHLPIMCTSTILIDKVSNNVVWIKLFCRLAYHALISAKIYFRNEIQFIWDVCVLHIGIVKHTYTKECTTTYDTWPFTVSVMYHEHEHKTLGSMFPSFHCVKYHNLLWPDISFAFFITHVFICVLLANIVMIPR